MPGHDGTGPRGQGPFTGRGEGYCAMRLPDPDCKQPAEGFAGKGGHPVRLDGPTAWLRTVMTRLTGRPSRQLAGTPQRGADGAQSSAPAEKTMIVRGGETMPRGDRRGPAGMGPMTGRGAGFCAGYDVPGYMNPGPGRGYGRGGGWGRGWGWRHWYRATGVPGWARFGGMPMWGVPPAYAGPTPQQEMDMLKQQADSLKAELDAINERIAALGAQAAPDKEHE